MIIIGLTGGVATGKSTVAYMLEYRHFAVFDADAVVADLYQQSGFLNDLRLFFPDVFQQDGNIHKQKLAQKIFADHKKRAVLEALIHPLVQEEAQFFLGYQRRLRKSLVFLNVPLLLQTGMDQVCDQVWVTSCHERRQRQRVLQRDGWDEDRWQAVRDAQLPMWIQRQRADRIIRTDGGKAATFRYLSRLLSHLH